MISAEDITAQWSLFCKKDNSVPRGWKMKYFLSKSRLCSFYPQNQEPDRIVGLFSLSKNLDLPAKRAFEIRFLPQLCRGKKHFYPHKCAVWRQYSQTVRAVRMFGGKVPTGLFRRSEDPDRIVGILVFSLSRGAGDLPFWREFCYAVKTA